MRFLLAAAWIHAGAAIKTKKSQDFEKRKEGQDPTARFSRTVDAVVLYFSISAGIRGTKEFFTKFV